MRTSSSWTRSWVILGPLVLVIPFFGACGDRGASLVEGEAPRPARISLRDLLSAGSSKGRASADLPSGVVVDRFESGLAAVRASLRLEHGTHVATQEGHHYFWRLPFAAAQLSSSDNLWPKLELPGLAPRPVGLDPAIADQKRGERLAPKTTAAWMDGKELHIFSPDKPQSKGSFTFSYPVQACRLVGAQVSAASLVELCFARKGSAMGTQEVLRFETSTELTLELGDFPGAVLHAALRAETGSQGVRIGFAKGDETPEWFPTSNKATPVSIALPAGPGTLKISIEGPEGELLCLDEPRLDFTETRPELADHPNVLLIILDTLRADRLKSFGGTLDLTPNLDRLASESLIFEQTWSTANWTLPAISAMMTGVHAEVHGGIRKDTSINPGIDTLAGALRDAGYYTEAISEGGLFRGIYGLDRGYTRFLEHGNGVFVGVAHAKRFFEKRASYSPWFLTLHSYEVHEPYRPNPALLEIVKSALSAEHAERIMRPTEFIELFELGEWKPNADATVAAAMEQLYNAEVKVADAALGRLLDQLRDDGVLDNTLVIFTADHGEEFGDHGLLGHGDTLYPEQVHVPLLLRFPDGWRAGEREPAPVSQLNLAPTIMDAVGLFEELETLSFAGTSLLRGIPDVPIYAWSHQEDGENIYTIRVGNDAYIEGDYAYARQESGPELYNLSLDPGAKENLANKDAQKMQSLHELLESVRQLYSTGSFEGGAVQLDPSTRADLEALGYL